MSVVSRLEDTPLIRIANGAALATLDQETPLDQHILGDVEHPPGEERPDLMGEPRVNSALRLASVSSSMPKRISASVTVLM